MPTPPLTWLHWVALILAALVLMLTTTVVLLVRVIRQRARNAAWLARFNRQDRRAVDRRG